jgi:hypothetical protein
MLLLFYDCRVMGKDHTNRACTNNADSEWTEEDDLLASIEEFCNPTEVLIFFTLPFLFW